MGLQSVSKALGDTARWVCLQVDFANAFNSMDRSAILREAAARTPAAFNYLRFAYGAVAPLYVGGTMMLSRTGTHQGCPLGPLGFALGLQPIAEKLQRLGGLIWNTWYLDDGVLIGDAGRIQQALTTVEAEAALIGLALNRSKCVLWGPGATDVPEHGSLTVRSWAEGEGITHLGVPIDCPGETSQTEAA